MTLPLAIKIQVWKVQCSESRTPDKQQLNWHEYEIDIKLTRWWIWEGGLNTSILETESIVSKISMLATDVKENLQMLVWKKLQRSRCF